MAFASGTLPSLLALEGFTSEEIAYALAAAYGGLNTILGNKEKYMDEEKKYEQE